MCQLFGRKIGTETSQRDMSGDEKDGEAEAKGPSGREVASPQS